MWRWTGFNMGLDLIVTYDNGNLSLKRYVIIIPMSVIRKIHGKVIDNSGGGPWVVICENPKICVEIKKLKTRIFRNLTSGSSATGGGAVSANGEHEALLSNHKKRHVYFRVSVASLNEQKQVRVANKTG